MRPSDRAPDGHATPDDRERPPLPVEARLLDDTFSDKDCDNDCDELVLLAAQVCRTPIALISLVDGEHHRFKAGLGLAPTESVGCEAFWAHTLSCGEPVSSIEDAADDARFRDNPLVHGTPGVRFYAGAPILMPDGHVIGTVCVIDTAPRVLDAAQQRSLQALARQTAVLFALADSQRRLRVITDNLPARIAHIDRDERYRFLNAPLERAHGLDVHAGLGRTMREVHGEALCAQFAPHVSLALRGQRTSFNHTDQIDDRERHFRADYIPATDAAGQPHGFYALTFDITELKETQARLELVTMVDSLTGLPNRRQFDERFRDAMVRTRRTMRSMAVMFIDLDRFKAINDRHGPAGGDAVLCEVARRLEACVRSTDTVARLAGDEFAVILEAIDGVLELGRLAETIVAGMRERVQHEGQMIAVTVSVGVSIYRGGRHSASDLLAAADDALLRARQQGRDRFVLA